MKKVNFLLFILVTICTFNIINSQSIAKSLGMYVFPSNDQDQATQDADESACYKWAIQQTGYDPLNPPEIVADQVDSSPDGAAVRGAAVGAAGGAAIGAIAGDAGDGAAIGAIVGGVRGRRAKRSQDAQQQEANNQAAKAKSQELENDYKKAFSVCMEGKGYTIK
ncbi:glycine zipper domain-containing protein [Cognatitamlana onchidii]|uniref:glycine zipper domain-containing protein n=1 Tax=Cognatitamlana onchidii TaxID=2562860 RepID=UPI00196A2AC6|nr:glycine zipper domain-containing protein [Algibacter onchidii]